MQLIESAAAITGSKRQRVESVVQTLAHLHSAGESLAVIAHDARNMVTALELYCDLLDEPGVLAPAFVHYGGELRLVAAASRRLVEKLVALDAPAAAESGFPAAARAGFRRNRPPAVERRPARLSSAPPLPHWDLLPSAPVANLAAELRATRNLLAALAGPTIALTVSTEGGAQPVRISGEDLTRVMVNLVKNAVEAMPSGGCIQITLREETPEGQATAARAPVEQVGPEQSRREQSRREQSRREQSGREPAGCREDGRRRLALAVEDNGPGIPAEALERIFESGYSGHAPNPQTASGTATHRGLGLAISRALVEAAGGRIHAENRALGGARMVMEFPVD